MSAHALWTVGDMVAAMGAETQGALPQSVSGISIDSRTIGPGEAFFAIADGPQRVRAHAASSFRAAATAS